MQNDSSPDTHNAALHDEILGLRLELADRDRKIRELTIQIETLKTVQDAIAARNPWKKRARREGPKFFTPGEGDY